MPTAPARVRCRVIEEADLEAVIRLLTQGFGYREQFWRRAFERLRLHTPPAGYPRFGYALVTQERPVGVMPMIFAVLGDGAEAYVRCNVSSWYVEPEFRAYAATLAAHATRDKRVTYISLTPQPHVVGILRAQGYQPFCSGRFVAVLALAGRSGRGVVERLVPQAGNDDGLLPGEASLLRFHALLGCVCLLCSDASGQVPIVLALHRKSGVLRYATLVYSRDQADLVRFAGPIGRFLARRGVGLVVLDADAAFPGLVGRYYDSHQNFFRGPHRPRLGDLAYSKRVFFGV